MEAKVYWTSTSSWRQTLCVAASVCAWNQSVPAPNVTPIDFCPSPCRLHLQRKSGEQHRCLKILWNVVPRVTHRVGHQELLKDIKWIKRPFQLAVTKGVLWVPEIAVHQLTNHSNIPNFAFTQLVCQYKCCWIWDFHTNVEILNLLTTLCYWFLIALLIVAAAISPD